MFKDIRNNLNSSFIISLTNSYVLKNVYIIVLFHRDYEENQSKIACICYNGRKLNLSNTIPNM